MSERALRRANPWWPRPLLIFLLMLVILAPLLKGLGRPYDLQNIGLMLLSAAGTAALYLIIDLIARARSGQDTRLGMLIYKLESFPFQRKLTRLEKQQTEPARLQTRGLMLRNTFEAPALIRVTQEQLELIPVFGEKLIVPLSDITEVVESPAFNGSWELGQTGIMLKGPATWRVGFAIYENPEPWREALSGDGARRETTSAVTRT